MAPAVEARGLRRTFAGVVALDDATFAVSAGEFFALLGPSGCGKTTLLRLIAGLDRPEAGDLRLHGQPALELPAHRRPVNTVFQSYALFPHLNVQDNVAFGLRMARAPESEVARRVGEALALVQIEGLGERRPAQLSGGQKQRVALARALVNRPRVLLLDEPLAALDVQLRHQLRGELRDLQRRTGVTFLLVTHDQEEALAVSDRIAVMRAGRIEQIGPGPDLYARPRTRFVAEFLGACNVFSGRVSDGTAGGCVLEAAFGAVHLPAGVSPSGAAAGATRWAGIRPENVEARSAGEAWPSGTRNMFRGLVGERTYTGAATELLLEVEGHRLRASMVNVAGAPVAFEPGAPVAVRLPPEALMVLED